MGISDLQTDIIKKILSIRDIETLTLFREILSNTANDKIYKLSDFEKTVVSESKADYEAGRLIDHETIIKRNKEWLEE
ncbi:MAG: hypothetical protein WA913_01310 [Pricia sp.]